MLHAVSNNACRPLQGASTAEKWGIRLPTAPTPKRAAAAVKQQPLELLGGQPCPPLTAILNTRCERCHAADAKLNSTLRRPCVYATGTYGSLYDVYELP